jgi:hypothetical protein
MELKTDAKLSYRASVPLGLQAMREMRADQVGASSANPAAKLESGLV